jgi:single-strand DNA-binding protein
MMIKLQMIGRVGGKPELRTTQKGRPVTNFNIAINEGKDENGVEKSTWYPITCWDGRAELAAQIVDKGDLMWVEGTPELRQWTGKDGVAHSEIAVNCKYMKILARSSKRVGENAESEPYQKAAPTAPASAVDSLDDIPF